MPERATVVEPLKPALFLPALIPTPAAVTGSETDSAPVLSTLLLRRDNTAQEAVGSAKKQTEADHVPEDDRPNDQERLILITR